MKHVSASIRYAVSVVLVIVLSLAFLPLTARNVKAETIASGTCGDNVTWAFEEGGTLIISGSGDMANYDSKESVPWYVYRTGLVKVVVKEGVTRIGQSAFYDCEDITSITLPEGVTGFEESAFDGCKSLEYIEIPDSVTSIGLYAFSGCDSLSSLEIPDSVTDITGFAFCGSGLTSITFPKGVTVIKEGMCNWCQKLQSVTLPEDVTSIENDAFAFCESLVDIKIPDGITDIKKRTFYSCSSLSNIEIPENVTSIGDDAFAYCFDLNSIEIPDGVTNIGDYAFEWCKSLSSIEIPDSVTSIGEGAFSGCEGITEVTIPAGVETIGEYAFGYARYGNGKEDYYVQDTDFIIIGHDNTEAKRYAEDNDFTFINLDSPYADYSKIEEAKAKIPEDLTLYTDESVEALNEALAAVQEDMKNTAQPIVDRWAEEIEEAIEKLEQKQVFDKNADYSKVEEALKKIPKDLDIYTSESVDELIKVLEELDFGKKASEQEIVDEWAEAIENAISSLVEKEEEIPLFNDVKNPKDWFYEIVYKIAGTVNSKGTPLMSGYKDGSNNFGPADPLTRQDFAVILYRQAGEPSVQSTKNPYPDADQKGYYYTSLLWAKENKVITGYDNGMFGVGDNITREQVATILYRYAKNYLKLDTSEAFAAGDLSSFTDQKSVSKFAREALTWANGAGIVTGKDNGTRIDPQGNAARAEIAAMVLRFQDYLAKIRK